MRPPTAYNVLDTHGGYTVLERSGDTLWRPGRLLRRGSIGTLVSADEQSFYQNHNDVTRALYKMPGQRLLAVVWFCNRTGARVDGRSFIRPFDGPCDCVSQGQEE